MDRLDRRLLVCIFVVILLLSGVYMVYLYNSLVREHPPIPSFKVVSSNSWITDQVSLHDFVPFGVALSKLEDGKMVIDREEGWTASNFVAFGMLTDGDNTLFFHPSINMGGSHGVRLVFNGRKMYRFLPGSPYYDESGRFFPYPTVHTNPRNRIVTAMAYDEEARTWYVKIVDTGTSPPTEILYVKGKGRLNPLWIGKPEGPFVVHGVAGVKDGWLLLDAWGGFLDFAELLEARYRDPETGVSYNFTEGFFFFDREYHKLLPVGKVKVEGGEIVDGVEFNAMSFHKIEGEEVEFIFIMARNPLPEALKGKFQFPEFERLGRINFVDRNESYRLDDYRFWTDGELQPNLYFLKGNITDGNGGIVGEVNLRAEAFDFWGKRGTENWHVGKPWWDPDGEVAWGRSFVKWRGTITLGNETITVEEALGFGEFHRYNGVHMPRLSWSSSWMTDILTLKDGYPLKYPFRGDVVENLIPDLVEMDVDMLSIQSECNDWQLYLRVRR